MTHRLERYCEAYLRMAEEAHYRPKAPGDGMGNVSLSAKQLADRQRLEREAITYAQAFDAEEDERTFIIGCSEYQTNRALIFTIEAARALCGCAPDLAIKLLTMAIDDIKQSRRKAA
jgi:hypothetical protein